jgi:septal ring factor EnvC (AmiA/AmiB activator)
MTTNLENASRSRKRVLDLHDQERELLKALVSCRGMTKGSVYNLKTRCGKPSCACARGRLHSAMVLSWSQAGKTRILAVQPGDLDRLVRLTEEYRTFRQARSKLVKLQKELLKEVDKLERALRAAPRKQELSGPDRF